MAIDPRFDQIRSLIDQFKERIGITDCNDEPARRHAWKTFKSHTDVDSLGWYQEAKYHPNWSAPDVVRLLAKRTHDSILANNVDELSVDQLRVAAELITEITEHLVPTTNMPAS